MYFTSELFIINFKNNDLINILHPSRKRHHYNRSLAHSKLLFALKRELFVIGNRFIDIVLRFITLNFKLVHSYLEHENG
ncbi:MAG: hypothetical protein BAJALOKI1v1_220018 [Promethearchaeota archaeon]|nr:MAG: hypothetical protein BAJALOKI1v1_220018 [Candidatus Lokiarchaeota archaeon]